MVAQTRTQVKPLVTRQLLSTAAAHGTGLDLRGLYFTRPTCEARALVRAQAEGLVAYHQEANRWAVPSASKPGEIHTLYVFGTNGHRKITCNCEAGKAGRTCKHAALVARRIAQEQPAATTAAATIPPSAITPVRSIADFYAA